MSSIDKIGRYVIVCLLILAILLAPVSAEKIIVVLKGKPQGKNLQQIKSNALSMQQSIMNAIQNYKAQGKVKDVKQLWIVNAIAIDATPDVIGELKKRSDVAKIIPDYEVKLLDMRLPQVKGFNQTVKKIKPSSEPWNLKIIKASEVWKEGVNGSGVKVAVVDTGINPNHIEFKKGNGTKIIAWRDFVNNKSTPYDDNGHGTHVAGIIAGNTVGVAPGVNLIVAKVFNQYGSANVSTVIEGFQWAVEQGAQVISYSGGAIGFSEYYNHSITITHNRCYTVNVTVKPYLMEEAFKPTFMIVQYYGGYIGDENYDTISDVTMIVKDSDGKVVTTNISGSGFYGYEGQPYHIAKFMFDHPLKDGNWTVTFKVNKSNKMWVAKPNAKLAGTFNLSGVKSATLKFKYAVNCLRVIVDNGTTTLERTYCGCGVVSLNISKFAGQPNVNISFVSDGGTRLDDIEIPEIGFADHNGNKTFWNATNWTVEDNPRNIDYKIIVVYTSDGTDLLSQTAEKIIANGTVVVAAAGNSGSLLERTIASPACAKDVIAVGAVDSTGKIAWFSSMGPVGWGDKKTIKPDIVAPGVDIESAWCDSNNGYALMSGTSMATPHVSGVVALMLQANSSLKPKQIKEIIEKTAIDGGAKGKDVVYGAGLIDAKACVENVSTITVEPKLVKLFGGTFRDKYVLGETVKLFALEWNGGPVTGENVTFEVHKWWWDGPVKFSKTVKTDENGVATVEFKPDDDAWYYVTIKDEHGNTVKTDFDVVELPKWRSDYKYSWLQPNKTYTFKWVVVDSNGKPVNGDAKVTYRIEYKNWTESEITKNVTINDGLLELELSPTDDMNYINVKLNYSGYAKRIGGFYVTKDEWMCDVYPSWYYHTTTTKPNETLHYVAVSYNVFDNKPVPANLTVRIMWWTPETLSNIAKIDEDVAKKILNGVASEKDIQKVMCYLETEERHYDLSKGFAVVDVKIPENVTRGWIDFEFNRGNIRWLTGRYIEVESCYPIKPLPTPPKYPPATPKPPEEYVDAWIEWGGHDNGKDYVPNDTAVVRINVYKIENNEFVPIPNETVYVYAEGQVKTAKTDEKGYAQVTINVSYNSSLKRWERQYALVTTEKAFYVAYAYPKEPTTEVKWSKSGNIIDYTIENKVWTCEYVNGDWWCGYKPVNRTLITYISKGHWDWFEKEYDSKLWSGTSLHGYIDNASYGYYTVKCYTTKYEWAEESSFANTPLKAEVPENVIAGSVVPIKVSIGEKGIVFMYLHWWKDGVHDAFYIAQTDDSGNATINVQILKEPYLWIDYDIGFASENYIFYPAKSGHIITVKPTEKLPDLVISEIDYPQYVKIPKNNTIPPMQIKITVKNVGTAPLYQNYTYDPNNPIVIRAKYKDYTGEIELSKSQTDELNEKNETTVVVTISEQTVDDPEKYLGCYTLTVTVDASNVVKELDEYNNNYTVTVCICRPNLVPFVEIPKKILEGEQSFTIHIKNVGKVFAEPTKAKLIVKKSEEVINETYYDVGRLEAGQDWNETLSLNFEPGTYNITLIADVNNDEAESNESDNIMTVYVEVIKSYEEPILSLIPDNITVKVGQNETIMLTLNNTNDVNLEYVKITLTYPEWLFKVSVANNSTPYTAGYGKITFEGKNISKGLVTIANLTVEGTNRWGGRGKITATGYAEIGDKRISLKTASAEVIVKPKTWLAVWIGGPSSVAVNQSAKFWMYVWTNYGGNYTINVTLEKNGWIVNTTTFNGTLNAWIGKSYELTYTLNESGTYWINATASGDFDEYRIYNKSFEVAEPKIEARWLYYPWRMKLGGYGWICANAWTNVPNAKVKATLTLPEGLSNETPLTQKREVWWNWAWFCWKIKADEEGEYGWNTEKPIEVKSELIGYNKSDFINTSVNNTKFWKHKLIVFVPKVWVHSVNQTMINDTVTTASTTFKILNVTTYDQYIKITIQAGGEGRKLAGLGYLVYYPYGCVEQVTSRMLGALHTDEYYTQRGGWPSSEVVKGLRDKANESIMKAIEKLRKGGKRGQHENGSWSMWGRNPEGDAFYTMYASYGLGHVAENVSYNNWRNLVLDNVTAGKFNFNDTIKWFHDTAIEENGKIYWKPWQGTHWYFRGHLPVTAWTMVSHYYLMKFTPAGQNSSCRKWANETMKKVTKYLIEAQHEDGGWDERGDKKQHDADAISTALAVWGLKLFGTPDPENNITEEKILNAIDKGMEWLIKNQQSDGHWDHPLQSSWWDDYGRKCEATAYALIALNESESMWLNLSGHYYGYDNDTNNDTIHKGIRYLLNIYRGKGSWGYTEATESALYALIRIQPNVTATGTLTIKIDNVPVKYKGSTQITVNENEPIIEITLDKSWIDNNIKNKGTKIGNVTIHTVTIEGSAITGPIMVAVENHQLVRLDEARKSGNVSFPSNVINSIMGMGINPRTGVTVMGDLDMDQSTIMKLSNSLDVTAEFTSAIVNRTTQVKIKIENNDKNVSLVPIVKIYLEKCKFNNDKVWVKYPNGEIVECGNVSYDSASNTLELGLQAVPNGSYVYVLFNVTPTDKGDVNATVEVTPMYNERVTLSKDVKLMTVLGTGKINIVAKEYNSTTNRLEDVSVDQNIKIRGTGTVNGSTIEAVEGQNITVEINKSGYVPIKFNITVEGTKNVTVILYKWNDIMDNKTIQSYESYNMSKAIVLAGEGNVFDRVTITQSGLDGKAVVPSATRKAEVTYKFNVTQEGYTLIAIKIPEYRRGSLSAELKPNVSGADNYWVENGIFYIEVSKAGSVTIKFEGRELGNVTGYHGSIGVDIYDAVAILRYELEKMGATKRPELTGDLWKYPVYGNVTGYHGSEGVGIWDAVAILRYELESMGATKKPELTSDLWR